MWQLLAGEDEALLVGRDAFLVLDLGLHVSDAVARLGLERDTGLARECFDKDLHATAQAEHQLQRGLLLDVVVRQRAAVFQLLAGEDEALLVGRDAVLVLDLGLHVFDAVAKIVEKNKRANSLWKKTKQKVDYKLKSLEESYVDLCSLRKL